MRGYVIRLFLGQHHKIQTITVKCDYRKKNVTCVEREFMFSEGHTLVLCRMASSHICGLEEGTEASERWRYREKRESECGGGQGGESESGQSVWIRVTVDLMKTE